MGSGGPSIESATGQWNESLPICPNIDIVDTLMRNSKADSLRDFGHALAMLHFKNENAFPGRAPPEKASECLVRRRLCQRWIQDYGHPGFTLTPPRELTSLVSLATHAATRRVARYQTAFYNFGQSVSREKAYHSYSKNTYPFSTQDRFKQTYFALQSASYHRFHDLD